jgi:hypothetical protein
VSGATVDITTGTATLDGAAQATYGSPDQFEVTGAGTITITSDTADPKAQITLSTYRLPYVVNSTAGEVSVPFNGSDDDEGVKYSIGSGSQLLDALNGVADGSELVTNGDFGDGTTGWTSVNATLTIVDGALKVTKTSTDGQARAAIITEIGKKYKFIGKLKEKTTTGSTRVQVGSSAGNTDVLNVVTTVGSFSYDFTAISTTSYIQLYSALDTGLYEIWDDISIKQISPAQGEVVLKWRPMFDAADATGDVNIITANDEATSIVFWDQSENKLTAFDGTNSATVDCAPVAGTDYEIRLVYGDNSGLKMQLILDGIAGALATFDESFPFDTYLSFAWETSVWQEIELVKMYKEPQSW